MGRCNLWYDCMFITMRIVVLILPVLVCDDILTVRIYTINQNYRFFCVTTSPVWGTCVVCSSSTELYFVEFCIVPYSTTLVIVFWISDPGIRSLRSLFFFWILGWLICDRWACVQGGYRIYFS